MQNYSLSLKATTYFVLICNNTIDIKSSRIIGTICENNRQITGIAKKSNSQA